MEQSINKTRKRIEYVVTRTGGPHRAEIVQDGRIVAQLQEGEELVSVLTPEDGKKYYFSPLVDGKMHPFSLTVETGDGSGETILKVLEHLFAYRGNLYIIGGIPEGKNPRDLGQTKYICRLVNFPYDDIDKIDAHVRERLGRHRGVEVGELSGLGRRGHKVSLDGELEPIGLPLSVACYLMYSAG